MPLPYQATLNFQGEISTRSRPVAKLYFGNQRAGRPLLFAIIPAGKTLHLRKEVRYALSIASCDKKEAVREYPGMRRWPDLKVATAGNGVRDLLAPALATFRHSFACLQKSWLCKDRYAQHWKRSMCSSAQGCSQQVPAWYQAEHAGSDDDGSRTSHRSRNSREVSPGSS